MDYLEIFFCFYIYPHPSLPRPPLNEGCNGSAENIIATVFGQVLDTKKTTDESLYAHTDPMITFDSLDRQSFQRVKLLRTSRTDLRLAQKILTHAQTSAPKKYLPK